MHVLIEFVEMLALLLELGLEFSEPIDGQDR